MDDELSGDFVPFETKSRRMSYAWSLLALGLFVSGACIRGEKAAPLRALAMVDPEPVDCLLEMEDRQSMVMLLSTTIQGSAAMDQLVTMARKLSPRLSDLKVLLVEDAALLKRSFWSSEDPHFHEAEGLNYQKLAERSGFGFSMEKVRLWTKGFQNMDGGWSSDNRQDEALRRILPEEAFSYVSIFETCASEAQAQAFFELQSQHVIPKVEMTVSPQHPCLEELRGKLEKANIIFFNGGNPDVLGYALLKFAPTVGQMIAQRVRSGSLLYLGRSAGAMVGSKDYAYTYEPMPLLAQELLEGDTRGLALAGDCVVRPHYEDLVWNIPARVMARARSQRSVFVPNGEGLVCDEGACQMLGKLSREGQDVFRDGAQLERVYQAFDFVYRDYVPPRPNLEEPGKLEGPKCGRVNGSVILASSSLEDPDAQEALWEMLSKQERPKVLVLQDAALFSHDPGEASRRALGQVEHEVHHASAFELCASEGQKQALWDLQSKGLRPEVSMKLMRPECLDQLARLLEDASVVMVAPGNVDLLGYVYKVFVPDFTAKLRRRVQQGSLVYVGLGAGAMLGGHNFALTVEPKPQLLEQLLQGDMGGLKLAGACAVRPHWSNSTRLWDLSTTLFSVAQVVDLVGLEDGDVLSCHAGACTIRGRTGKRGAPLTLQTNSPSTFHGRLDDAMAALFARAPR